MAGRAHAAALRAACTVFDSNRPTVRLVAIADANGELADSVRRRFGFDRAEHDWQAVATAADIDAVVVAVDNRMHMPIVERLSRAGKHVLCEKPLAPTIQDAQAMVASASAAGTVAAVGFTYRRSPAICAIREEVRSGRLGDIVHFSGQAWFDYAVDPHGALTWRYLGSAGSGALADVGSHLVDPAEFLCGPIVEVRGGLIATVVGQRPLPASRTTGHAVGPVTNETGAVENEDLATFTARFRSGTVGTFSVSRVAHARPDGLSFQLFGAHGSASFDLHRLSEFTISDTSTPPASSGVRTVFVGPHHPYVRDGLPIDSAGVGHGTADLFVFQARAFLDQIAGFEDLPPCATFDEAISNRRVLDAVIRSAAHGGEPISPNPSREAPSPTAGTGGGPL